LSSHVPQWLAGRRLGREEPKPVRDDPITRMIARANGHIRPARAYRWRLRGRLLNQYVAMREGLVPLAPASRARMGSLGRAVLFASVALAISVSAVGAASSSALPGDPLYSVKREVEELRMQIAPPSVRPALAAGLLEERLSEVELLAAAGNWARVTLGEQEVDAAVATLQGFGGSLTEDQVVGLQHHTQVLTALLARAPLAALPGLERALAASAGVAAASNPGGHLGQGNLSGAPGAAANNGNHGIANNGGQGGGKLNGTSAAPSATPVPSESQPSHLHSSPSPRPSPQPTESASPDAKASPPAH
jgi:hypothetical protein